MKKTIIHIVFIFATVNVFAQTGRMEVIMANSFDCECCDECKYVLFSEDNPVIEGFIQGETLEIAELNPGVYDLEIYRNDTLLIRRHNMMSKPDTISNYLIDIGEPYYEPIYKAIPNFEGYIGLSYGPNMINEDPFIKESYILNMGIGSIMLKYGKHFSLWFLYGVEYVYTAFNDDTTMYPPAPAKNERYSNFNLNLGFYHKISFFESQGGKSVEKVSVDLGAMYNFPLFFRHAYNIDKRKFSTRGLHQFKNFSAFGRISYKNVALTCDYRLFDFVKGDFPEVPKLTLGVSVLLKE